MILDDFENYLFTDMDIAQGNSNGWSYPSWPSHLDHILITNELFDNNPYVEVIRIDEDTTKTIEVSGPNCERKKNRPDGNKAEWNLVTRKDIKAGEELTLEYNLYKPD